MKHKLNNKGNTLGIVMIGIFILSILGTLILGLTSTNLNMKLTDKKTEMTFYYAEKAMDELYAAIGTEVMDCTKEAYSEVLENYIKADGVTTLTSTEAKERFKELLIKGDTTVGINGITSLYKDGNIVASSDNIGELFTRFNANAYITSVPNYTFTIFSPASSPTSIVYKKADGTEVPPTEINALNLVEIIEIKNIGVECVSNNGYYSSIVTDFEIAIPNINMDFSDSKVKNNLDDLAQYSLIAEGSNQVYNTDGERVKPAIQIGNGTDASNIVIKGNVYANGTAYSNSGTKTFVRNNNSIEVANSSKVTFNSKIVDCENNFLLTNATAVLGNYADTNTTDATDSLQFYTGNIETKGDKGSSLTVVGNCIVKDDLEINGSKSVIKLTGNYFGYGFRNDTASLKTEADTEEITGFITSTATATEHTQSSAIIINENKADVDMTGLKKLVLAGRAYVDLDASGTNASYMTGESISFKGNQHMYLAELGKELSGSKVTINPMPFASLELADNTEITYSELELNTSSDNQVVAKKINDEVYFYVKNTDPLEQTQYFQDTYKNNEDKRNEMKSNVKDMEAKLQYSNSLKSYTVGTILQVDNEGNVSAPAGDALISGEQGILKESSGTEIGFYDILDDIAKRKAYLVPSLKDVSTEKILGSSLVSEAAVSSSETPFEYYIKDSYLTSGFYKIERDLEEGASSEATRIREILGITDTSTVNVGYLISNDTSTNATTSIDVDFNYGVIISKNPVKISKNFNGLIICNETIYISGNVTISSAAELVKYMFDKYPDLSKALKNGAPIGESETGTIVDADGLQYTDLIEKKNWRKNIK